MKFTPIEYLMMDIAARHSQDKANWENRLAWFKENQDNLDSLVNSADEPAIFIAAVKAYRDTLLGIPSGYPVSLDCSNSGMQILSILTGDRKAASLCNVIPHEGNRQDGYTVIYGEMLRQLGQSATISREDVKDAIMTSLYGSEEEPRKVFGEGLQLEVFYKTMEKMVPLCWELNKNFLEMWDETKYEYSSVMPDNFHSIWPIIDSVDEVIHFNNTPYTVTTKVNAPKKKGRFLSANTTHEVESFIVRELIRRCAMSPYLITRTNKLIKDGFIVNKTEEDDDMVKTLWDHYTKSGMLSARIIPHLGTSNIHIVDESKILELLSTIPKEQFDVMTIHDCVRVLPNYAKNAIDVFRQLYVELAESEMLSYLLTQLVGNQIQIRKGCYSLSKDIKEATYIIS